MRNFGQSVSFLYNYIREAHPNPDTAPCGPTEDLGWNHPSWNTSSIEERAQRARWLKTDFDLTYPFIMDTMNNEMMAVYQGSRFYSGWVIDCDGFVFEEEPWGWATPATQWCGLRLADNDDLVELLTQYVFRPPSCFDDGPAAPVTRIIPAVSRVKGFNNTIWRSDVVLANPHDRALDVELKLRGLGDELPIGHITLDGGASVALADVVGTRVEIMPSDEESAVIAYASVVDNASGDPTFIEAVPHTYAWDVVLPGVAKTAGADGTQWLSEVALVNRNPHTTLVTAEYRQRGGGGTVSDPVQITLGSGEVRVIHDPVATLFGRDGSGAIVLNGADGIAASGRTFNTGGASGTFGQLVAGLDLSGEAILRNDLKAHLIGLEESPDRRTNLGLVNAGMANARARIRFFDANGNQLGLELVDVPVGEFIQLDRIFRLVTDDAVVAGRIEITLSNGRGRITGYASTIDLGTGDPVYQPLWIERDRGF